MHTRKLMAVTACGVSVTLALSVLTLGASYTRVALLLAVTWFTIGEWYSGRWRLAQLDLAKIRGHVSRFTVPTFARVLQWGAWIFLALALIAHLKG